MTRTQAWGFAGVFGAAVLARLGSLPHTPFFCDVPSNVSLAQSGKMIGGAFPGYVAFHWTIRILGGLFHGPFSGAIFLSFICGLGAMIYCAAFAYERAGFRGGLLAVTLIGFSPVAIYFSVVGASYATDMLGMSALIYHGNRALAKQSQRDFRLTVLWFVFSCLMRTLSFPFSILGVLYLLGKFRSRSNILFAISVSVTGALLFWVPTLYYYHTIAGLQHSLSSPADASRRGLSLVWMEGNEARNVLFFIWAVNIFLILIPLFLWQARKFVDAQLATFFLLLAVPYFCVLLWYVPHAGYICMLLPALICVPWVSNQRLWLERRYFLLAAVFVIISFLQFFVARPVKFQGKPSLVANTYVLTYTHRGIERGMFGNYQQWLGMMEGRTLDVPPLGWDD